MQFDPEKLRAQAEEADSAFDRAKLSAIGQMKGEQPPAQMVSQDDPGMTWADVGQVAKSAVLPTAGAAAGMGLGMLTGPFAPAAVPTLEALGGMGGEKLNQMFGITEPSNAAVLAQGVLPPLLRGGRLALKVFPPSTHGAATLNEIAPIAAKEQLGKLGIQPGTASFKMGQAASAPLNITTGGTRQEIANAYGSLAGSTAADVGAYKGTKDFLRALDSKLSRRNDTLSLEEAQKELRDIPMMISKAENETAKRGLIRVKEALENAVENDPNGKALIGARKEYLRENVHRDLVEMTYKQDKNMSGQGTATQFNAKPILDMIEGKGGPESERFRQRFQKAFDITEQREIKEVYRLINKFDKLAPPAGVNAGSYHVGKTISLGLGAGALATASGAAPPLAAAALAAGVAAPVMLHSARIFSLAMQTSAGRHVLFDTLKMNPGKPLSEIMQKVAVALSATEPVQTGVRNAFPGAESIQPFPNER